MDKKKIGMFAAAAAVLLAIIVGVFLYSKGDHTGPNMTVVSNYEANYGERIGLFDLVRSISDESEYTVKITAGGQISPDGKSTVFEKSGNFSVEITAQDANGYTTVKTVTVKVTDAKPPMLYAKDITISLGDPVDYRTGVTAEDEMDGNLTGRIQVDTSLVDETKAGVYPVIYTVSDDAGNLAEVRTALTIQSPQARAVSLSRQNVSLDGNGHYQLTASVEPSSWTGKIQWSTSNPDVAVVSDGLVTWIGSGSCTITAKAGDVTSDCQVECGYVSVSSIQINKGNLELNFNETGELTVKTIPSNWEGDIIWSSSNPDVATVEKGIVSWNGQGECIITATADGKNSTCAVVCNRPMIEKITIPEEKITLGESEVFQLKPVIEPDIWEGELTWTSSDPTVATVQDGLVRWVGAGTCTITVSADEQSAKVEVTCEEATAPDDFWDSFFGGGGNNDSHNGDNNNSGNHND